MMATPGCRAGYLGKPPKPASALPNRSVDSVSRLPPTKETRIAAPGLPGTITKLPEQRSRADSFSHARPRSGSKEHLGLFGPTWARFWSCDPEVVFCLTLPAHTKEQTMRDVGAAAIHETRRTVGKVMEPDERHRGASPWPRRRGGPGRNRSRGGHRQPRLHPPTRRDLASLRLFGAHRFDIGRGGQTRHSFSRRRAF